MFYHEDGIPNEDAFVDHLAKMGDGDKVDIPEGMRRQDALICVGAAETRTHICFTVKSGTVYAHEDPYVTLLFNAPMFSKGVIPYGERELFLQAVRKARKKRNCSFKISGSEIRVEP